MAKSNNNSHYGTSQAIAIGDLGMFWAMQILNKSNFPDKTKIKSSQVFLDMVEKTISGEILDVYHSNSKEVFVEKDYDEIVLNKTSWYTFIGPLKIGGVLANTDSKTLDYFTKLGTLMGAIFQLRDDWLGVFGDSDAIGKSNISDILENKKTKLTILLRERADKNQLMIYDKICEKEIITENDAKIVKKMMIDLGIDNDVVKVINNGFEETVKLIKTYNFSPEQQITLITMSEKFLTVRKN